MSLTTAELEERRQYLGGSDAPALAGMNPPGWAQPIDVFMEKRPDLAAPAPKRTSALMGMGSLFEDDVAALFTAATGMPLRRYTRPVRSRRYPWMGGHLDRQAPGAIFEAKWQQQEKGFGPTQWAGPDVGWLPIPAVVPPHYMLQVQHYLIVTGKPVAYVGLLLGYAEFRCYRIPSDPELQVMLIELEQRFWHEHVLPGVPPQPDGSEGYGRVIAAQLAQDRGTEVVATPEQQQWMRDLHEAQLARKAAEQAERLAKQRLQLSLDDAASLVGPGFSASYRTHEVRAVGWERLARDLWRRALERRLGWVPRGQELDERLIERTARMLARHYTTTTTQRPFRPKWDDEEEPSYGTN